MFLFGAVPEAFPASLARIHSMSPADPQRPKNAIVILLDSLNRHMIGAYGGGGFGTPNLHKFARRAARFHPRYAGALPAIPARHQILCGALHFLLETRGT